MSNTISYSVGDRVFYNENGPTDTGSVTAVDYGEKFPIRVQWDTAQRDNPDWYTVTQITKL